MKKALLFIFLSTCLIAPIAASEPTKCFFRNTKWGMSKQEVIQAETIKLKDNGDDYLIGKAVIANMPMIAYYYFIHDQLYLGIYYTELTPGEPLSNYVSTFYRFKKLLTSRYGKPSNENDIRIYDDKSYYRRNPDEINHGLERGEVSFDAKWDTPETGVSLSLDSGKGKEAWQRKFVLTIDYWTNDKKLQEEVNERDQTEDTKDL